MDRGLIHVYTGDGKGKTSAAMGMVLRSLGYGHRVCVGQFMKGAWESGEKLFMSKHEDIDYIHGKTGFSWIDTDRSEQREDVLAVLDGVREAMERGGHHMLILDEINVVMDLGYIEPHELEEIFGYSEKGVHVLLTGRGAPEVIRHRADLITEMKPHKHPFDEGIPAKKGVDY